VLQGIGAGKVPKDALVCEVGGTTWTWIGEVAAFGVALDARHDLGAGYAGLTSFAQLEPEFVKLDMTLVRDIHQNAIKQKLVGSMARLCKDMGIAVVAEGIEIREERDSIIDLGCDLLQGYLIARPGRAFPEVAW
jgi:EAL domain-containing protein (putative c-di-GMP-specific phosphodiesterase class I)